MFTSSLRMLWNSNACCWEKVVDCTRVCRSNKRSSIWDYLKFRYWRYQSDMSGSTTRLVRSDCSHQIVYLLFKVIDEDVVEFFIRWQFLPYFVITKTGDKHLHFCTDWHCGLLVDRVYGRSCGSSWLNRYVVILRMVALQMVDAGSCCCYLLFDIYFLLL